MGQRTRLRPENLRRQFQNHGYRRGGCRLLLIFYQPLPRKPQKNPPSGGLENIMTQKIISKRQWRDGVSAKPKNSRRPSENTAAKAKRPSEKPASGRAAVQRPSENKTSNRFENRTEAPKQHAAKAKKLVVRNPNRKIMERARDLKERRSDLSRMEPERLQKVLAERSEERRVGKECRSRWSPYH